VARKSNIFGGHRYNLRLYALMDIRQLRYLIAIAEAGSFLGAAEQLHISQPALTKAIKALERRSTFVCWNAVAGA
jgi:DNA-binding MarR family transcriptional regulator